MVDSDYPYLQSTKTLKDLPAALRKTVPSVVDVDYVRTACNVSEGTARNIIVDLRRFGFVDEDGQLTERGRLLRNPERHTQLAQEILHELYPTIVPLLELHEDDWTRALDNLLIENTDLGNSARAKVRATISLLLEMAGAASNKEASSSTTEKKNIRERKQPSTKERVSREEASARRHRQADAPNSVQERLAILSSILRVTVDGTWDQERLNLLFDRLERLLGSETDWKSPRYSGDDKLHD